jgi:hypothetical protein
MNHEQRTLQLRHWLTALLLCIAASGVSAAGTVSADEAPSAGSAHARLQQRFISEFSEFAGSAENAQSLYSGLRSGSRITLTMPAANSSDSAAAAVLQFNPAGRSMGIGSAFISMALAKQQLARHGITRAAPAQIHAALNGGAVTPGNDPSPPVTLKGVLVQREQGVAWQTIAKASGISPGKVLDGLRDPPAAVAVAGSNPYSGMPAAARGNRYAVAAPGPGTQRTVADTRVQSSGLTAQ